MLEAFGIAQRYIPARMPLTAAAARDVSRRSGGPSFRLVMATVDGVSAVSRCIPSTASSPHPEDNV